MFIPLHSSTTARPPIFILHSEVSGSICNINMGGVFEKPHPSRIRFFLMLSFCFRLFYHRHDLSDALFPIGHHLSDLLLVNVVQMKAGADGADAVECRGYFSGQGNGQGVIAVLPGGIDAQSAIVADGRAADVDGAAGQKNQHIGANQRDLVLQRGRSAAHSQFHDSCPQR